MKERLTKLEVCDMELELAKKQDKPAHWFVYETYLNEIAKIVRDKILNVLNHV